MLWGVVYDHVVEEPNENGEIGLWGFNFIFFDAEKGGEGRE